MSQTPPPQGQIESPNPLELFWEQHRSKIYAALTLFLVIVVGSYGWQYLQKRERDAAWSELATAGALDRAYVEPGDAMEMFSAFLEQNPGFATQMFLQTSLTGLSGDLLKHLKEAKSAELEKIVAANDARSPLAAWLLAGRAVAAREWDAALARLAEIEQRFPEHFLVKSSSYPVQWRDTVPEEEDEEEEKKPRSKRDEPPELVAAEAGSAVSLLRASIERAKAFEAEHTEFYVPPEPTSAETVTFEISNAGRIKIRLYPDAAPEHVARFLELARSGYWQGQRIHEIQRARQDQSARQAEPGELHFGWSTTTDEDRGVWEAPEEIADENVVAWEVNDLSHFPGMVAALVVPGVEGKSQVEQIAINSADVATLHDGARVIFGRVVEGLDVVESIVNSPFIDDAALTAGAGQPEELYTIESVTVE